MSLIKLKFTQAANALCHVSMSNRNAEGTPGYKYIAFSMFGMCVCDSLQSLQYI